MARRCCRVGAEPLSLHPAGRPQALLTGQHGHPQLQQARLYVERQASQARRAQLERAAHAAQLAGGRGEAQAGALPGHRTNGLLVLERGRSERGVVGGSRRAEASSCKAQVPPPQTHVRGPAPISLKGPTCEPVLRDRACRSRTDSRPERYSSTRGSAVRTLSPSEGRLPPAPQGLPRALPPAPHVRLLRPQSSSAWCRLS